MADESNKITSGVQADNQSIAIGGITVGGDVSGNITIGTGYTSDQVSALITQIKSTFQPMPFDGRCPYKGLDVFEEDDAELFFGREKLVDDLVSRVKESRTVFITGPSGSGKSSLVRAGLIHALKQGKIHNSERWLYGTLKPGRDPLDALAAVFSRLKSPELGRYFREHAHEPAVLNECAESVLSERKDQRFVLFIDQFEEVFTQIDKEPERTSILALLTHAATVENGRVILLFSMRSDFVSNCATYPQLNSLLNQQFIQIGAMQPDELVSAIAQPALRAGLGIDPDLIAQIINDMKGEPGALPLMQFALKDLFDAEQAKGNLSALTRAAYLERGGIHKSLKRHADNVFAKLSTDEQQLARSVFSGLIEIGRGTQDTKRTAVFDELIPASAKSVEVEAIVRKLADARLITTDEAAGKDTVTISHEKLIDAWPWLKKLVNENRDVITLQNEIAVNAKEWEEYKQDISYLYKGARLANACEQLGAKKLILNDLSQRFISTSQKEEEQEIQTKLEKERQIEIEKATAKRQRRLTITLVTLFTIVLLVTYYRFYVIATESTIKQISDNMINTIQGTAKQIDGDQFYDLYTQVTPNADGYTDDPRYWEQVKILWSVKQTEPLAHLYTYHVNKDNTGEIVLVTSSGAMENPPTGAKFLESSVPYNFRSSLLRVSTLTLENGNGGCIYGSKGCKLTSYRDASGRWVSAYAPIRNSKGEAVGVVGIDFEANYISEIENDVVITIRNNFILTYAILLILVYVSSDVFNKLVSKCKKKNAIGYNRENV